MTFRISKRPDITDAVPTSLSRAGARAARESTDKAFQIGINGMGFTVRTNGQHPYMREADEVRKEQFDSSDQAGEQSLGTWWRRSQDDWSLGEGIDYYEPGVRPETDARYVEGQGVNPWTQGSMSLLHSVAVDATVTGTSPVYVSTFRSGGEDGYAVASGDTIQYRGAALSGETRTNHFVLPAFLSRNIDGGTTANMVYTGSDGVSGRKISWTGATGINSFVLSSGDAGSAGTASRHAVAGLPSVFTVTVDVTSGPSNLSATLTPTIVFYDASGSAVGTGTAGTSASLLASSLARLRIENVTVPSGADTYRLKVAVARTNGNVFASTEWFRIGLGLIEEGTFLKAPFCGATPDAGGVDYSWVGAANTSKSTAVRAPVSSITLAGGGLTQPVVGGPNIYYGRTNNIAFTTPGGAETVIATCTGSPRVWWAKRRLLVALGSKVYWINHKVNGQALTTNGVLIADGGDGWEWVDVSDSPDSILMAGTDGTNSFVYAVTVTADANDLPTFTGAAEVARLPYGERITCMGTYLGAYVALGTSLGIRIGLAGDGGRVQYGPILKTLSGVTDVSFYDTFAYFAVTGGHPDGSSGLWRVDLSTEITDTGRNPYASDVYAPSGEAATSVAFLGGSGRPVFAVGAFVHLQSESFLTDGWWTNGKVRFRTTELKDFQSLLVAGSLRGGQFDHRAIVDDTGEEHRIATQTAQTGLPASHLDISGGPLFTWLQLKTYATGLVAESPLLESWTLSAIPQPKRSRMIRYPLMVWDNETATLSEHVGYPGFAFDRIAEIEQIEDSGIPVLIEDSRTGESFIASIETAQFTGEANSDRARENFGGHLDVTVRIRP